MSVIPSNRSDRIQFWIMVCCVLTLAGSIVGGMVGFAAWADARYWKASQGKSMSWELHALYLSMPEEQRAKVEKQREQFEMEQDQK